MASIAELKSKINLHDLAERLGLERPLANGNYRCPLRPDKHPSLSIYNNGYSWLDHASGEGGSCIDLVMYVEQLPDESEAMRRLNKMYGFTSDHAHQTAYKPPAKSQIEWIADKCMEQAHRCKAYLVEQRQISEAVVEFIISRKSLGFNDWHNIELQPGEQGYGGEAVAFFARDLLTRSIVGIDYRYIDPTLNGGRKTKAQGVKAGAPFIPDYHALKRANTVYLVESAINALSVMTAFDGQAKGKSDVTAVALRGLHIDSVDFRFLQGKFVVVCMDNDKPIETGPQRGKRPGAEAAWKIYDALVSLDIPCMFVDHKKWGESGETNDVNELLQKRGAATTKNKLCCYEYWLIPGLPGKTNQQGDLASYGRQRLILPDHDFSVYWQYRVKPDFMSYLKLIKDEDGTEITTSCDLAGFRLAALSEINIASATSALTGEKDNQPHTVYAASVQVPRDAFHLKRYVFRDEELHNIEKWKRFGPVFRPAFFSRMLTIMERCTHIGKRQAINFVGIAWRDGKPVLNEGANCYFTEPDKQCPYHNLTFPSGSIEQAQQVIEAYAHTFKSNAGLQLLVWALGAHLKTFLGKWPHMVLQADKGTGKSTLIKHLERTISFTMLSGQSMKSEFRLITSIAHTTHPVGWEELSAQGKRYIDLAVAQLQESYNYTITRRGSDMLEYVLIAPVLLAGEDVPVDSLLGKVIRADINKGKGQMLPQDLPCFPVKQWLQYLTRFSRPKINELYQQCIAQLQKDCIATEHDNGAIRMRDNYACAYLAWQLLCKFSGVASNYNHFPTDLITEMNGHIKETDADREPWVWILELIFGELDAGLYRHPYTFSMIENVRCVLLRTSHVMQHISQSPALKNKYDALPVKSDRVLKRQLIKANVVQKEGIEKTVFGRRVSNLIALSLPELKRFGLTPSVPDNTYFSSKGRGDYG